MRQTGQKTAIFLGSIFYFTNPKKKKTNKRLSIKPNQFNRVSYLLAYLGRPVYYFLISLFIICFAFFSILKSGVQYLKHTFSSKKRLHLPKVKLPKLPKFNFKLPVIHFSIPKLPNLPHFSLPPFNLKFPQFNLPRLPRLPRPRLKFHPIIIFFLLLFTSSLGFYFWIIKDLPSPNKLATLQPELATQIFDRNGELLYKIYANEKRTLVNLEDIPLHTRQATIAIEDKNFYEHQGFSIIGIGRAIKRNFSSKALEGGSTITQQLIKNTLLSHEKTLTRKIKEIILAVHTELIFDKDQILQMYFNQVGFGGPAYGIQEASQQYFNKNVSDLTLAESAFLAGLPQAPTRYSPFGANPHFAKERQLHVLKRMVEDGYITNEQAEQAAQEELTFATPLNTIKAPHFVMYVKDLLVEQFGEEMVTKGGLQVHTSLDLSIQETAEKHLNDELIKLKNLRVSNGATLVTEPKSGQVLAMVGSKDYFDVQNDGQVNLTLSLRQPGSSVKPINYALALEKGYTPASIILDAPTTFSTPGSPSWTPQNYDGKFHGPVTLRTALASSYNIPATKLLAANGINQMVELAKDLGITTWDNPARFGLSLTLGSNEVKMTEMAEVYGTFANLGVHVPLNPIISIIDSNGKNIEYSSCKTSSPNLLTNEVNAASDPKCLPQAVISSQTAYLISNILSDNQARSPAFGANSVLNIKGHQVAVKTGTSNDLRDNWTIGYTENYLVATWVGNNDNTPMSRIASGVTGASPIWAKTITTLLKDSPSAIFSTPQNIVKVPICALTGTLTCSGCPYVKLETFVKGTEPTRSCSVEQINSIITKNNEAKEKKNPKPQILPIAASTSR